MAKKPLPQMSKDSLMEMCSHKGISLPENPTNAQIREAIRAHDEAEKIKKKGPPKGKKYSNAHDAVREVPELRLYISMDGFRRYNLAPNEMEEARKLCEKWGFELPDVMRPAAPDVLK